MKTLPDQATRVEVDRVKDGRAYLNNGTSWSFPDERFSEVNWRLRYAGTMGPELTMADRLLAAEAMSNYADIITHPSASLRVTPHTALRRFYKTLFRRT